MNSRYLLLSLLYLFFIQLVYASGETKTNKNNVLNDAITPDQNRQTELLYMIRQDCGSCHGMTLKGGLGPSLLPQRIAQLPHKYLSDTIASGRKGTPMPPWAGILTPAEIDWIVNQLKSGIDDQLLEKNLTTPGIATSTANENTQ